MVLSIATAYNDDIGRVQISWTGANGDADYAKVEHSLDQISWSTIRGGDTVPTSGGSGHIDHYDGYVFGVPNYYRVTAIDSALIGNVGTGTYTTGNNATLVPPLPAGIAAGNMMVLLVTHRNTAATITTPTGWTRVSGGPTHQAAFYRVYQAGDTAPSVAFSGGSAGDSCSAMIRAFSNAQAPVHSAAQSNASAQDVAYPGASQPTLTNLVWIMDLWKQIQPTTGATFPTGFSDQQGGSNAAGANTETHVSYVTTAASNVQTISAGVSLWTGGGAAISKARLVYMARRDYTDQSSTSYTPVLPNKNIKPYWLMNPQRPGQNIRVEATDLTEITNAGRTGVFEVLGRSWPVVLSDFMASDTFTISFDAENKGDAKNIASRLALGEPMYLLVPDIDTDLDTLYFSALSMKRRYDTKLGSWTVDVECRQIAQPAPSVYGSTYVWADVVANYATWADVVAGNSTWSNLVDKVSNNVIVVP